MKHFNTKSIPLFLIFLLFIPAYASRTIFIPRQITFNNTFELALANFDIYDHRSDDCTNWFLYATPFYAQSANKVALARYFLPNNKSEIVIAQDGSGDINSVPLRLIAPPGYSYYSVMRIRPERKAAGAMFSLRGYCSWLSSCLSCAYLDLNTTLLHVNHNVHLKEMPESQPALPPFMNACDAFNNPVWKAGKISCFGRGKIGLDDIQLKLGYDWYLDDGLCNHLSPYIVGGIPTGTKPESRFLFEPLVGSRQGSIGCGINVDYLICLSSYGVSWMADLKYRYVLPTHERRLFDLITGDWSRYSYSNINALIMPVKVFSGSTIDLWTALHYQSDTIGLELGYDFWWRQAEHVEIDDASINNIKVKSAEHPWAMTNTIYGAVSFAPCIWDYAFLFGLIGSYEFATPRSHALEQWTILGKVGFVF